MTEKEDALPDLDEFLQYDDSLDNPEPKSVEPNSGLPTHNPSKTVDSRPQSNFNPYLHQSSITAPQSPSEADFDDYKEDLSKITKPDSNTLHNRNSSTTQEQEDTAKNHSSETAREKKKKKAKAKSLPKPKKDKRSKYRIEPPEKHKGKVILEYGDGSKRVRPEMTQLIQHNSKIAWQVFLEEYPDSIRTWWDKYRYTPKVFSLILGLIIGLFIAGLWQYAVPLLGSIEQIPETPYNQIIIFYLTIVSTVLSGLAAITLFIAGLVSRSKDIKLVGKEGLEEESFGKTVFRFVPLALYYGPLFIVILLIKAIFGLISFMGAVARAT